MITKSELLINDKVIVDKICDFYLSKGLNTQHHEEIIKILTKSAENEAEKTRIKLGMFSYNHFFTYISRDNNKHIPKEGIDSNKVQYMLELLEDKLLLKRLDFLSQKEKIYQCSDKYVQHLEKNNLIHNLLFGFEYIIERYKKSVIKIENTGMNGDIDIGTGFLFSPFEGRLVITNEHVIAKSKKIRLLDDDDNELNFEVLLEWKEKDIALLKITDEYKNADFFSYSKKIKILSEIITIGYPSIPMSKFAYQVCHKGEINSLIEDYNGNEMFLISAKTSSGNSGSPVIDKTGLVIGMVARELFEKEALIKKGKLPYFGVIPSYVIEQAIEKYYKKQV